MKRIYTRFPREGWEPPRWEYRYWPVHWERKRKRFSEVRQNIDCEEEGVAVRGKRRARLIPHDEPRVGRAFGKSWKDYTKRRKQSRD